MLIIKEKK